MIPYVTGKAPVIFTVSSAAGARRAIQFADDLGLKPILSGGADVWKAADLLAKKKIPFIYNIPINNSISGRAPANDYDPTDTAWTAPAVLQRAGVKVCFETLSAAEAKNLPRQVGIMCAYGLPREAAIRALTLNAAEVLGVADQMGSLDAGKLANIIVTDGDPLEVTTNVHNLFIAGKPISLESKHTRLYALYRQRLTETPSPPPPSRRNENGQEPGAVRTIEMLSVVRRVEWMLWKNECPADTIGSHDAPRAVSEAHSIFPAASIQPGEAI